VGVDQCGATAFAAILHCILADGVAFDGIGAIAFGNVKARKTTHEFRNAAASGLDFYRHGNGVTVVFDQIQERKFLGAGDVEGFPKFAFAGGAVSLETYTISSFSW